MVSINTTVNGVHIDREIAANVWLLDFLRDDLGLTGTNRSCDVQVCGSCTVLVDGLPVSSCTFLANELDGATVETIEGVRDTTFYRRVESAFVRHAAVQCGFCTPGFVMTLKAMVDGDEGPADEALLRRSLSGNLCRCTGYRSILDAALEIMGER
jgi:aerobic-type carbon monoxide dehydrogenase small subunit (CoxS/CutS family)